MYKIVMPFASRSSSHHVVLVKSVAGEWVGVDIIANPVITHLETFACVFYQATGFKVLRLRIQVKNLCHE